MDTGAWCNFLKGNGLLIKIKLERVGTTTPPSDKKPSVN
jgi:hypothetical protein